MQPPAFQPSARSTSLAHSGASFVACPHARLLRSRGFTLVEILVAAIITALVAAAATTAVSQLLRLKARSADRAEAASRADAAASRIALDLTAAVRNPDPSFTLVQLRPNATSSGPRADELLLLARSNRPVRGGTPAIPEGGEFSVQYRLMSTTPQQAESALRAARPLPPALWRRSNTAIYAIPDAGGIAAPVVPGINELMLEATDGNDWFSEWDSDSVGLPHAVRVTVVATSDNFQATATARRVVAIDRVPIPIEPEEETAEPTQQDPQAQPGAQPGGTPTQPGTGPGPGAGGGGGAPTGPGGPIGIPRQPGGGGAPGGGAGGGAGGGQGGGGGQRPQAPPAGAPPRGGTP